MTTKTYTAPTQEMLDARLQVATKLSEVVSELGYDCSLMQSERGAYYTLVQFGNDQFLRLLVILEDKKRPVIKFITGEVKGSTWQQMVRHSKDTYVFTLSALLCAYADELESTMTPIATTPTQVMTPVAAPPLTVEATVEQLVG